MRIEIDLDRKIDQEELNYLVLRALEDLEDGFNDIADKNDLEFNLRDYI